MKNHATSARASARLSLRLTSRLRPVCLAIAAALALGITSQADAVTRTWDGGADGNYWNSLRYQGVGGAGSFVFPDLPPHTNWSGFVSSAFALSGGPGFDPAPIDTGRPTAGDSLVFQGTVGLNNTNTVDGLLINGISFADGAGAFVLGGAFLNSVGDITNSSSNLQTFNLGIVVGANQTWDGGTAGMRFNGLVDLSSHTLTLANQVRIDNTSADFVVGRSDSASTTLNMTDNSVLNTRFAWVGSNTGQGQGTVVVSGVGSQWNNLSNIVVGSNTSVGLLNLQASGVVSTAYLTVYGKGSVTLDGGRINAEQVSVIGGSFQSMSDLDISRLNDTGIAQLSIGGGGIVTNGYGFIASTEGSRGRVDVSGAGARWVNTSQLSLGDVGEGTLGIFDGGFVRSSDSYIGKNAGAKGTVIVSDIGSQWHDTNDITVGNLGNGTLLVRNGGAVSNNSGFVGREAGGVGTASITGAGSAWTNATELSIGEAGTGTLDILDSAVVKAASLFLGYKGTINLNGGTLEVGAAERYAGGVFNWLNGMLSIKGSGGAGLGAGLLDSVLNIGLGSTLNVAHTLTLGDETRLNLTDGRVTATTVVLNTGATVSGFGQITGAIQGGAGSKIVAAGGYTLNPAPVPQPGGPGRPGPVAERPVFVPGALTLGDAQVNGGFNFAGDLQIGNHAVTLLSKDQAQLGLTTSLAEGGKLITLNGANLANGNTLTFSGNSTIQGNFTNHGSVQAAEESTGTLSFLNDVNGAGSYAGNIVFKAAFNPGNSPAAVSFNGGNATFDSASVLNMEFFGATPGAQYDQLVSINALTFNGTLNLVFGNGYVPLAGSSFALFGFNNFSGSFGTAADGYSKITVAGYDRTKLDFSHLATDGTLSVTAVPEPETYAMLLAGLALMGTVVRRRRAVA